MHINWFPIWNCLDNPTLSCLFFIYILKSLTRDLVQFIFSTAIDGKIKAWLYDCPSSRVDYDAPGHWCTTMAYSADGSR